MPSPKGSPKETVRRLTRQALSYGKAGGNSKNPDIEEQTNPTMEEQNDNGSSVDEQTVSNNEPVTELSINDNAKIDWIFQEMKNVRKYMEDVDELKRLNKEKDLKISELENKIDALEQYSRLDNIVVSGFKPVFSSYARATSYSASANNHEFSPQTEKVDIEEQIVDFLNDNGVSISTDEISICHTLPNRDASKPKPIVIKLKSRKAKIRILQKAARSQGLKTLRVYVNEHLTSKNGKIAARARELMRRNRIEKTWIRNCRTFIKTNTNGEHKVYGIGNINELERFENS